MCFSFSVWFPNRFMAIKWVLLEPFVSLKSWATGGWGNFLTKSHPSRFFYEELAQGKRGHWKKCFYCGDPSAVIEQYTHFSSKVGKDRPRLHFKDGVCNKVSNYWKQDWALFFNSISPQRLFQSWPSWPVGLWTCVLFGPVFLERVYNFFYLG